MNIVEIIIDWMLPRLAVPDACRRLGRSGWVFSAFVAHGLPLGTVANADLKTTLREVRVGGCGARWIGDNSEAK